MKTKSELYFATKQGLDKDSSSNSSKEEVKSVKTK